MRFLLPIIGIGALIVTWYALEIRFAPKHIADEEQASASRSTTFMRTKAM
jgi:hypothetical protein